MGVFWSNLASLVKQRCCGKIKKKVGAARDGHREEEEGSDSWEIVSGRKNHDDSLEEEKSDLLSYTWNIWQEQKALELVDPSIQTRFNSEEVIKCIQLGLLCCQASIADRPEMNAVHLMLESDSFMIPKPGKPGYQGRVGRWATYSSTTGTSNTKSSEHSIDSTTAMTNATNSLTSSVDDYPR
ncbi:hypothetical protein MKW98_005581 [Papaver atlanticum]|uniref:Uncharacterized protein n=1 Tax=Papaver atlanticum TaxID=357466 RepID=A0AAD4SV43_9MAGN|nr:hypothetical protein MKW98_005581 [Papaver atlanticum]